MLFASGSFPAGSGLPAADRGGRPAGAVGVVNDAAGTAASIDSPLSGGTWTVAAEPCFIFLR